MLCIVIALVFAFLGGVFIAKHGVKKATTTWSWVNIGISVALFALCMVLGPWGMRKIGVAGFPMILGWQTVGKPHNMGPRRDDGLRHPHAHEDFDEMLAFFSLDPDNMTDLHGELSFSLGAEGEEEPVLCTESTVFPMRKGYFHLPLVFTKVDKPMIFMTLSRSRA